MHPKAPEEAMNFIDFLHAPAVDPVRLIQEMQCYDEYVPVKPGDTEGTAEAAIWTREALKCRTWLRAMALSWVVPEGGDTESSEAWEGIILGSCPEEYIKAVEKVPGWLGVHNLDGNEGIRAVADAEMDELESMITFS